MSEPSLPPIGRPWEGKFNPEEAREKVRTHVAYWLLLLLTAIVAIAVVLMIYVVFKAPSESDRIKEFIYMIFTPILTTVGTVLGFYFGEHKR